jgi:flavin reductase (DIM6/NTAB) family NADH-FMN oxidoreductase RutF
MSESTGARTGDGSSTSPVGRSIEAHLYREVMASVCSPVAVVTATAGGEPHGATVSSLAGLSMQPPLITVAFDRRSALLQRILAAGRFGVNLLSHQQVDLAALFARRQADRFGEVSWRDDGGLPRLDGAAGWMACELYRSVPGGDHLLLFGLVTAASRAEYPPLVYAYRTFGSHSRFTERPRPPIVDQITACAS